MQKGRFHYYRQWHRGADTGNVEISQKEFSKLLAEHYCYKVTMMGDIGVSFADYEAAEIEIRKIKRRKQDMTIYSCGDVTLTFRKDRVPGERRFRDTRYPDQPVRWRRK